MAVTDAQRDAFAAEAPLLWDRQRARVDYWLGRALVELAYTAFPSDQQDAALALYAAHKMQIAMTAGLASSPGVVTSTGSGAPSGRSVQPLERDPALPADLYTTIYGVRLAQLAAPRHSLTGPVVVL